MDLDLLIAIEQAGDNTDIRFLKRYIATLQNAISQRNSQDMCLPPIDETKVQFFRQRGKLARTYKQLGDAYEREEKFLEATIAYWKSFQLVPNKKLQLKFWYQDTPPTTITSIDLSNVDANTCFYLSLQYYSGIGVTKNHQIAVQCCSQAASQEHAPAAHYLAWLNYEGKGVPRDKSLGAEWDRRSAQSGYAFAQRSLGWTYELADDFHQALHWYQLSALQGDAFAQYHLGQLYLQGLGLVGEEPNGDTAEHWLQLSALQGYRPAQTTLDWKHQQYVTFLNFFPDTSITEHNGDHIMGNQEQFDPDSAARTTNGRMI